ncbi:spermidine synthase [bacterium]|nr:MAG: spermidine synthase [bacterium]
MLYNRKIIEEVKKWIIEIAVFICGMVVMIFEIVGSRVLGPFLGTSIFVWTSLIGVILGSLSIGYWIGGKIADKKANLTNLAIIIFLAAICISLTALIKNSLLSSFQTSFWSIKQSSILASIILFFPASMLLGIVTPYAVKLKLNSLDISGSTVGNLYAVSTVGSIVGTFLAGFFLVPKIGTTKLLFLLSIVLVVTSIILSLKQFIKIKICILILIIFCWGSNNIIQEMNRKNGFIDVDTEYNHVWIYNYKDVRTDQTAKVMSINNESSSAMFLENDDLVYEYTKYYHLVKHFNPTFKKALAIGGAAYSYPKDYLKKYSNAEIDVVEIDPKLTELAKKYFNLKENPRLNIFHEDGRTYLNKIQKKYDVIFGDAFKSYYSLPYQLTTQEAVQKKYDILNDNGIVILNIISSIEGVKGKFLRAEYTTYKSIFPQVYLFPVNDFIDGEKLQNIILVALKSENIPTFKSADQEIDKYLQHLWTEEIDSDMPILTDDFSPVDHYINQTI